MNVNDIVQERIDAARRKIAADKQRREELAEARKHGLTARHRQKLRNLRDRETRQQERADQSAPDTRAHQNRDQDARGTGPTPAARTRAREAAQKGDGS